MSLSVLIPARNEQFLNQTIEDVLSHIEGDTDIIVVLDGEWMDVPQHEKVTVLYRPVSVGQRAATNDAARLSNADYVMKLDAHCSVGQGFDVKMMEDMEEDITMVPTMYNLHAFDWVCTCGHRSYQGPTIPCPHCGGEMTKDIIWKAKPSPETTAMRFDPNLRFQYWGEYKKKQEGDLVETMSLLGACWMLSRKKYWELDICDEKHGSWGQQGTEVACKTWLSGGRLLVTRKTWFAHLFRTQGGDFSFPYAQSGKQIAKAREYSRHLWLGDNWDKATRPLSWLIDKFDPPGFGVTKGIIYYTDNRLNVKLAKAVQKQIARSGLPIVSASLKPMTFGKNIHLPLKRGYLTMFKQILAALEAIDTDVVFFCEHDVLYHPSHFEFTPTKDDVYYYNTNVWKLRLNDGFAYRVNDCRQLSGLCANRDLLIKHYKERIRRVEAEGFSVRMGFEPGTHNRAERVDDYKSERWESEDPNVDICHGSNLTPNRWSPEEFRNKFYTEGWRESNINEIPGWDRIL